MKTGRTLQDLAAELDRQAGAKRDFIVPAGSLLYSYDSDSFWWDDHSAESEERGGMRFPLSSLAHRQLGDALNIPAKYYDRCRQDNPMLLSYSIESWLHGEQYRDKRYMVRTLDNSARAFLSSRYRRIDNYDIAQAALPVVGEMADARVESCEVTENRMYLKVVNPHLTAEVKKGDVVQAGIVISNSEVGLDSVSVMPLVYRLACLNGMIVQDYGQRKYHIGRENEEAWELFSDETLQADDAAFMLKLADIVRTAVDEAKFSLVLDKLREAAEARITAHLPDVVELTSRQYGFNKSEETDILRHLIEGGDLSLWGLSNAVTRASHDVPDYDRATALEGAGWQVATMPRDIWQAVNGG